MGAQHTPGPLARDVEVFLARALPHFMAGKSVKDSLLAVLADDARIVNAALDRGHNVYFPTADDRGRCVRTGFRPGDIISSELAATVYRTARARSAS